MMRMMRMLLVVSLASGLGGTALAQDGAAEQAKSSAGAKAEAERPKCPMMDEPIDFTVSTMTDEGPVYFCCAECIEHFKAEPAKHAADVKKQREALAKMDRVQVSCPLEGGPLGKRDVYTEAGGQKVYFCCPNCRAKYEAEPAQYEGKLAAAYTYQTRCPVSGSEINPASYVELENGQRVYFCCDRCDEKLLAEPAKYTESLHKQGYMYKAKDLKAKSPE